MLWGPTVDMERYVIPLEPAAGVLGLRLFMGGKVGVYSLKFS